MASTGEKANHRFRRVQTSLRGSPQSRCKMRKQSLVNTSKHKIPRLTAGLRLRDSKSGLLPSCIVDQGILTKLIPLQHPLLGPEMSDPKVKGGLMFPTRRQFQSQSHSHLQPQKRIWMLSLVDLEIQEMQTMNRSLRRVCNSTPLHSHSPAHSDPRMTILLSLWIWTMRLVYKRHRWARPIGNNFTVLQDRTTCQTRTCTGERRVHQS